MTVTRLAIVLAASIGVISAPAQEWSRFRGPNGSGVSGAAGLPTEFGRDKSMVWRAPVRAGKSSPVLAGRHVFLTGYGDGKLYTQCFDRETGKLLWERAEERPRGELRHTLNEPAAATPVTDGENVYAFFPDFGAVSYDPRGNTRWKVPMGPFTNIQGMATSPILAGGALIVVADQEDDSYVTALALNNGEVLWKVARDEKSGWGTPLLFRPAGGAAQLVTASRGQLGGHRLDNGARAWTYRRLSPAIVSSPVLNGDVLYTFGYGNESAEPFDRRLKRHDRNGDGKLSPDELGGDAYLTGIGRYEGNRDGIIEAAEWDEKQKKLLAPSSLLAIRLERDADGISPRELWRYERSFVGVIPSPLYFEGVVYVIKNGGILTSFDGHTGEVAKAGRLQGAIGGYSASPVAAPGAIYFPSEDGKVAVVRPGKEWEVIAVNDLGESCFATPALTGDGIYLRTSEALYRFGAR